MRHHTVAPVVAVIATLLVIGSVAPGALDAQVWHHVHLASTDPSEAQAWYIEHMGAEARGATGARIGSTAINLWERDASVLGSVGSVLDHIGFSVPDLEATMARLRSSGVEIMSDIQVVLDTKIAFVRDPWGTRIEMVEDPSRLGFHHVHAFVENPREAQRWFARVFGGEPTLFLDAIPAVDYEGAWLFFGQAGDAARAPSSGRSFDHIGFTVPDMEAALRRMVPADVEVTEGPRPNRSGTTVIAYVAGPGGISIELLEARR